MKTIIKNKWLETLTTTTLLLGLLLLIYVTDWHYYRTMYDTFINGIVDSESWLSTSYTIK